MAFILDLLSLILFIFGGVCIFILDSYEMATYAVAVAIFLQIVSWRNESTEGE